MVAPPLILATMPRHFGVCTCVCVWGCVWTVHVAPGERPLAPVLSGLTPACKQMPLLSAPPVPDRWISMRISWGTVRTDAAGSTVGLVQVQNSWIRKSW